MTTKIRIASSGLLAGVLWLAGCAAAPPSTAPTATTPPATTPTATEAAPAPKAAPHWSSATEAQVAAALDKKFESAAKGYTKLMKDGVLMFCKRYRVVGSNIATIQCITEAQLRNQVESMNEMRERQRVSGKCTLGVGCGAGS